MKKVISFSFLVVLILALGVFIKGDIAPTTVRASATDNVSGWAWSDNIGWISFNNTNTTSAVDYGVKIDGDINSPTYGDFSGYAWSDNVGWISFNRAETGNPPLDEGDDPGSVSGGGIAKVDLSTGVVTGWARVLSATGYNSSISLDQCPFTDGPGRRVVSFDPFPSNQIRSQTKFASYTTAQANIPIGIYDITLVSYDNNTATQMKEQWFLKFSNNSGGSLSMNNPSDAIADRPDSLYQIFQMVQKDFTINFSVDKITATHSAYPDTTSANSIYPVCAVFDDAGRWDGWIKLGGTSGPTQWTNEVSLDITSGSPTENQFSGYAWGSEVMGWIRFDSMSGFEVMYNAVNLPPTPPIVTPVTPADGLTGVVKTFIVKSTDPNYDDIKYGFDWDNDLIIDEWIPLDGSYVPSGSDTTVTHTWTSSGTYSFKVLAEDEKGLMSDWTTYDSVIVTDPQCNNKIDDDSDTWTDYPDDPGCSSLIDDNESDNPECSDGMDNDKDGYCDYDGATCTDGSIPGDPSCNDRYGIDEGAPVCNKDNVCGAGETILGCPQDCFQIKEF